MGIWKKLVSKGFIVLIKMFLYLKNKWKKLLGMFWNYWVYFYFMNGIKYGYEEVSVVVRGWVL